MVTPSTSLPPPDAGPRSALVDAGHAALLGESPALREALCGAERAALAIAPLLVRGERGSGVADFARLVHALSPRSRSPFVVVECAAPQGGMDDVLLERLALAEGATLFLDDVDALSPAAQSVLLRALASPVDVRVVAGTRADLRDASARGAFREDLLVRLAEVTLAVPPLRERAEDVPALASHFAALASRRLGRAVALPRATLTAMQAHRWPMNLPELRGMVDRLVASAVDEPPPEAAEYRVPVRRDAVTLTLADGSQAGGTLFFLPDQKLEDLFEHGERFVPVEHGGRVRLYARDAIACVSAEAHDDDDAHDPRAVSLPVRVRLRSGASFEGEVRYLPAGARGRAVDFLNGDERGFAVRSGGVVHFVAKSHVEHVEER